MFLRWIFLAGAILLGLASPSCQPGAHHEKGQWREEQINGRHYDPTYAVKVPESWTRLESAYGRLDDTRIPLVSYLYTDNNQTMTVTVHNFPAETLEDRIPPLAQVERWKKQFDFLEPRETETKQVAFGGYTGYFFKGVGKLKDEQAMVLAWSLQLPQESFRALTLAEDPVMDRIYGQMRSDVTIKAVGPMELIAKRRNEIEKFANSFHLIREIPSS